MMYVGKISLSNICGRSENIKIKVHWSGGGQVNKALSKPIIPNQCNEFQINVAKTSARIWIFSIIFLFVY